MSLWDVVFKRPMKLYFAEDNEAMIKICKSGHLSKMRHLQRTHKVNAAWTADRFREDPNILLDLCKSIDQAADIYTKRFTEPRKWQELLYINAIVDPHLFWNSKSHHEYFRGMLRHCNMQNKAMPHEVSAKVRKQQSMVRVGSRKAEGTRKRRDDPSRPRYPILVGETPRVQRTWTQRAA